MSKNCHYFLLFKNLRDNTVITNLAKQMYHNLTHFLTEAFKDATEKYVKKDTPNTIVVWFPNTRLRCTKL